VSTFVDPVTRLSLIAGTATGRASASSLARRKNYKAIAGELSLVNGNRGVSHEKAHGSDAAPRLDRRQ
jgi:hypothetical protein